ncbi:MAG: Fe-S cluster assembly protein SufB [Amaricoccus sp.]
MAALDEIREGVDRETVDAVRSVGERYKYGFSSDIETEYAPKGLNEDIVRLISAKNEEPEWLTDWRVKAYRRWLQYDEAQPEWAMLDLPTIDFQDQYYYARPKSMAVRPKSLDEVDPALLATYEKLGIPLKEQMILAGVEDGAPVEGRKVAVDAVFDSVSVGTTFQAELAKAGVIFCSMSEAVREHPELVRKYLGTVVPYSDNFYATLNSAVFSDGSFVYVPPGVRCPMELSTYFRINAENTGQFERTLIIADKGAYVSYLEGCTAPKRDTSQLHAAVVEIVALEDAEVKYSTVQNWFPGDEEGRGGVWNFVTKRADCREARAKVMWTQVETGSAITWKYPSCILRGEGSQGEFYSIAIANNRQQADTGTKMHHLGKNTRSRIVSKGISAGFAQNTYRGLVSVHPKAVGSRNYTQCDSLLIGENCGAHTVPYIECRNNTSRVEHEATTSKVDEDQLFYCRSRGMDEEEAVALVVNGFCREVLQALPMEFAIEAQKLVAISLEGSVG